MATCAPPRLSQWWKGVLATEIADHRGKYGPRTGWVVLADPEGNEFCILRNAAERST